MSRGPYNHQTITDTRKFLSENRQTIVTIFKRYAKIGGGGAVTRIQTDESPGIDLRELVRNFVLLISATDFLDVSRHPLRLLGSVVVQSKTQGTDLCFALKSVRGKNKSWSIINIIRLQQKDSILLDKQRGNGLIHSISPANPTMFRTGCYPPNGYALSSPFLPCVWTSVDAWVLDSNPLPHHLSYDSGWRPGNTSPWLFCSLPARRVPLAI